MLTISSLERFGKCGAEHSNGCLPWTGPLESLIGPKHKAPINTPNPAILAATVLLSLLSHSSREDAAAIAVEGEFRGRLPLQTDGEGEEHRESQNLVPPVFHSPGVRRFVRAHLQRESPRPPQDHRGNGGS